ncbi:hypothetical protein KI387_032323, partial [Taxus chinensis]
EKRNSYDIAAGVVMKSMEFEKRGIEAEKKIKVKENEELMKDIYGIRQQKLQVNKFHKILVQWKQTMIEFDAFIPSDGASDEECIPFAYCNQSSVFVPSSAMQEIFHVKIYHWEVQIIVLPPIGHLFLSE